MQSNRKIIRGKSKKIIQERLNNYCKDTGKNGEYHYYLFPNGISIPKSYFFPKFSVIMKILSGIKYGFPTVISFGVPRANIRIKNNIRINFKSNNASKMCSAKISLPAPGYRRDSLAREIKARKILTNRVNSINLPELYRYDSGKLRWFEEQYISADNNADGEKLKEKFLIDHGTDIYKPFVRARPIKDTLNLLGVTVEQVKTVFKEADIKNFENYINQFWPISFIHGDLSPGNMILSKKGKLYIIDWEKFRVAPVSFDFTKLFMTKQKLVCEILKKISDFTSGQTLEPLYQMKIVLVTELIKLKTDHENKLKYRMNHLNESSSKALKQLENKKDQLFLTLKKYRKDYKI